LTSILAKDRGKSARCCAKSVLCEHSANGRAFIEQPFQVSGLSADTRFGDAPADASEQVDKYQAWQPDYRHRKTQQFRTRVENKRPVTTSPQSLYFTGAARARVVSPTRDLILAAV
jgi:hypothetical protein